MCTDFGHCFVVVTEITSYKPTPAVLPHLNCVTKDAVTSCNGLAVILKLT